MDFIGPQIACLRHFTSDLAETPLLQDSTSLFSPVFSGAVLQLDAATGSTTRSVLLEETENERSRGVYISSIAVRGSEVFVTGWSGVDFTIGTTAFPVGERPSNGFVAKLAESGGATWIAAGSFNLDQTTRIWRVAVPATGNDVYIRMDTSLNITGGPLDFTISPGRSDSTIYAFFKLDASQFNMTISRINPYVEVRAALFTFLRIAD
jgi:hypothetical protein